MYENTKLTQNLFLEISSKINKNNYDYSLVNFIDLQTPIKIICKNHGVFEQTPLEHLNNQICPKCKAEIDENKKNFILKSNKKYDFLYDYSNINYIDDQTNVTISCKIHGLFKQKPINHMNGDICDYCKNYTIGKQSIISFLNKNNIKYIENYKNILIFDFYLPLLNTYIEYDGIQDYNINKYYGHDNKIKKQVSKNNIKKEICKTQKSELIFISLNEYNNIENFLMNIIY